ncbi:outer dense fiber protein 3-B isoform X2 [Phlebotomus argentipes]|nr:outer dense fiber protein 3-B isoform X2 [Phlebotomus argentipes]
MFSFGTKKKPEKMIGRAAQMPLGMDSSNITRFGKQEAPKFSIAGRRNTVSEGAHSPGPVYSINDRLTRKSPPAFSISGRTKQFSVDKSPGPKYAFNPNTGKSSTPSFSLARRLPMKRKTKMPSPAEYPAPNLEIFRPSAPKVSMKFRRDGIHGDKSTPGPKYFPSFKSSAKAFSFGVRHHPCSGQIMSPEDEY